MMQPAKSPPYEPKPPTMRLEGAHAKRMMDMGHAPGDTVMMHVQAKVTKSASRTDKPKERWDDPQHEMHFELQKIDADPKPKKPKLAY